MSELLLFNKPFGILSQFSGDDPKCTLAAFIDRPGFYPAGRLDKDSEGLLLLTNDGKLQAKIADPKFKQAKTYWSQVEGAISEEALDQLKKGVMLKDGMTLPAEVKVISEPNIWPRVPPIRQRIHIPTTWIELKIKEGRNRQVRRMTAAVGFPTLRLVRANVAHWGLGKLEPGESTLIDNASL